MMRKIDGPRIRQALRGAPPVFPAVTCGYPVAAGKTEADRDAARICLESGVMTMCARG